MAAADGGVPQAVGGVGEGRPSVPQGGARRSEGRTGLQELLGEDQTGGLLQPSLLRSPPTICSSSSRGVEGWYWEALLLPACRVQTKGCF